MTISPEEAKRLAHELLDDADPVKKAGQSVKGPIGVGSTIGRYRIESLIATGGMGAVYRATHEQPTRVVALKVVRPELLSSSAVRRFRHETELLGRLQHPGIAQIYEADSVRTDLGDQPYFAMELVEGEPLLDHADEADLSTRDRLELFLKVCDAVEHAHRKGVIHRDLKPGNVLVTKDGQPKVLDFGVAKATDADIQSTTLRTNVGQLVGTLPYMSPEQVGGDAADLDTRSDVYSLGVLLYHLLSGQLPYEIKKGAVPEALRTIQEEDPAPLSSIDKTLRGDVETIVGKALEKDRDRRYQGASDLAGDIRRYLANETITARPASAWYQVSKFSRRNRGVVVAGGLLVVSLMLGMAGTTGGMLWAIEQMSRAEKAEQATIHELTRVTEVKRLIREMISSVSPQEAEGLDTALLRKVLNDTADRLANGEIGDDLIAAELHNLVGEVYLKLGLLDLAENHLPIAMETRIRLLGKTSRATLGSTNNLANLYHRRGRLDEAEKLYVETLRIRKQEFGDDDRDTLASMQNLALIYSSRGQFAEAESLQLNTLQIKKRVLGKEHPETLDSMHNLAITLKRQGRYAESEMLYDETLQIKSAVLGKEHPETLASMGNLANVYVAQGRYREAEQMSLQNIEIKERVLGEEHPDTLASLGNLANLYRNMDHYDQAEPLYLRAIELKTRVLGESHVGTLETMHGLAILYRAQDRLDEAEPLFKKLLDIRTRELGEDHPSTIATMHSLAILYRVQDRYVDAEPLFLKTLETRKRVLGPEHPETSSTMASLGNLYNAMGRYNDAHEVLSTCLPVMRRTLGDNHTWTWFAIEGYAEALLGLDQREYGLVFYRELLELQLSSALESDASARTLNEAAMLLLSHELAELQDLEQALGFAKQACAKGESQASGDLWSFLDTLALAQYRSGDTANAIESQKRAIALMPESVGEKLREKLMVALTEYEEASRGKNEL